MHRDNPLECKDTLPVLEIPLAQTIMKYNEQNETNWLTTTRVFTFYDRCGSAADLCLLTQLVITGFLAGSLEGVVSERHILLELESSALGRQVASRL